MAKSQLSLQTHTTLLLIESYRNYPQISIVSNISISTRKSHYAKQRVCNWTKPINCKKTTLIPCMNDICEKTACSSHSTSICFDCTKIPDLPDKNILLSPFRNEKRKRCDTDCKNQTFTQCAVLECKQFMCGNHEYKICHYCKSSLHCTDKFFVRARPPPKKSVKKSRERAQPQCEIWKSATISPLN